MQLLFPFFLIMLRNFCSRLMIKFQCTDHPLHIMTMDLAG